ncbi:DUF2777 domain-containing protein [Metabacillus iocasae]|uniref:DUF2777 domain-containing protein n=1 Tax=Priestia iocasae TaxID=2291674 RepID=A0ABS2QT58_9BACI|nr:DUF2777 domain-containing protein [Metabacillus iocasae]MBM7702629.1 hypothetical protein [Metabacillus iocasae]
MKYESKLDIFNGQERCHTTGIIECIDSQWVFFEEDSDEASMLNDIVNDSLEIHVKNTWQKAMFISDNVLKLNGDTYMLRDGDQLRVRKKLQHAYEELLQSLSIDVFSSFTSQLNSLGISLYDCIYCHNTSLFLPSHEDVNGVNFIIYDNEESICSVHHLFSRGTEHSDRFEYTMSNGKRVMNIYTK